MGCGGGVNREVQTYMPSGASKDSVVMTAAVGGGGCDERSVVPPAIGRMAEDGKTIGYAMVMEPMGVDGGGENDDGYPESVAGWRHRCQKQSSSFES